MRTIIEDSLCAAALLDNPDDVIRMLKEDAEHSRRGQASFISEQRLGDDPAMLAGLDAAIQAMDKKPRINWKAMAKLSTMTPQYLSYLRLSDGAVHTSATSLDRHIARRPDRLGWAYRMGPGEPGDIAATLHSATLAAMPVGIVVTQIVPDPVGNAALASIGECFQILPKGNMV